MGLQEDWTAFSLKFLLTFSTALLPEDVSGSQQSGSGGDVMW